MWPPDLLFGLYTYFEFLHAEIRTVRDPNLRVKIVEERMNFDQSPESWFQKYENEQLKIQATLVTAQNNLSQVTISQDFQLKISQVCSQLDVDGLRGDIVTNRAAKAFAAFDNRTEVTVNDISKIITLCLRHRLRKDPLESIDSGYKVKKTFEEIFELN